MLKVYDFSVDSVDILIFGAKDIEYLTALLKQQSNKFENGNVRKNSPFIAVLKSIKDAGALAKTVDNFKDFLKLLIYSYKIERYNCSVVVTAAFHHLEFHNLSIAKKNRRFVALTVGYGHYVNEEKIFGRKWEDFNLQGLELLVQGNWQRDMVNKKCENTSKIKVVGGLGNALYLSEEHNIEKKYDICIISNFKDGYGSSLANAKFYSVLHDVCLELGYTVCFAGRYTSEDAIGSRDERRYVESCFGNNISFFPRSGLSTYVLSDSSSVTIGDFTTALLESFARGRKIIAANPSSLPQLDFLVEGVWTLSKYDYESVKQKLLEILSINQSEWFESTSYTRESLSHNGTTSLPLDIIGKTLLHE
tara:strand:- start:1576 stop:2664 length:1089 start_codon:yes stop_codon:yes gene_type:complete